MNIILYTQNTAYYTRSIISLVYDSLKIHYFNIRDGRVANFHLIVVHLYRIKYKLPPSLSSTAFTGQTLFGELYNVLKYHRRCVALKDKN